MEKKHFVKTVTSFVAVLLKMALCLCINFIFTKNPLFKAYLKLIHQTSPCIFLATLTCPLKTCVRSHNLISMNIYEHKRSKFFFGLFLYICKEKAENGQITKSFQKLRLL